MPRKLLNRILPTTRELRDRWYLRPFDALLHDPAILATHRKNVLKAFAVGLTMCFLPLPIQTVSAALLAVWLRVNVAVAIVTSLAANPITIPPLYYFCWRFGSWLLDEPVDDVRIGDFDALMGELLDALVPLIVGCIAAAAITVPIAYVVFNRIWIWSSRRRFHNRRRLRRARATAG